MRIYPEKGYSPTREDCFELASAATKFGLAVYVGREKTSNGYRHYVELMRRVEIVSKDGEQHHDS